MDKGKRNKSMEEIFIGEFNFKTKCPKCGYEYDLNEEISKEIRQKDDENKLLRNQLEDEKRQKDDENRLLRNQLEDEKRQKDDENRLLRNQLEEIKNNSEKTESALRQKLEEEIKQKLELDLNHDIKHKIDDAIELGKCQASDELNRFYKEKEQQQEQKHADELKAYEIQIAKLKDVTRKASDVADHTSNDIKGKIGEDNLEILIRNLFPHDRIEKIGTRGGGDFIQTIIEGNHKCGKILYECKYAERFNKSEWISKIKEDSLHDNCDRNVIVTKVMPVGNDDEGNDIRIERIDPCRIDGVWICSYNSVAGVIKLLRDGIVHQDIANISQFDRSNKKEDLYVYVTSNEFLNDGNDFRDKLEKRRKYLEDYLKRTTKSIKLQIVEVSEEIQRFDNIFSRIYDITGKCQDTEIVEDDDDVFLKAINNSVKKKKSRDQEQITIDDAWS